MVRQQLGLPLTVPRNRNRITNKSRLKVYKGDLDAESYIPDDDDEKTRLQQSVAGVDQEDANVGSTLQPITARHRCGCVVRGLLTNISFLGASLASSPF